MTEEENWEYYDERLKDLSLQIIERVNENGENFTDEEEQAMIVCNNSMNFWIKHQNMKRAIWEAENTLKILKNMTEW